MFTLVIERHKAGKKPADYKIPPCYVYGKGHVTFFFDKCMWACRRYTELIDELHERGFNLNVRQYTSIIRITKRELRCTPWWNDWQPTAQDYYLNFARLARRAKMTLVWKELNLED